MNLARPPLDLSHISLLAFGEWIIQLTASLLLLRSDNFLLQQWVAMENQERSIPLKLSWQVLVIPTFFCFFESYYSEERWQLDYTFTDTFRLSPRSLTYHVPPISTKAGYLEVWKFSSRFQRSTSKRNCSWTSGRQTRDSRVPYIASRWQWRNAASLAFTAAWARYSTGPYLRRL